MISGAALFRKTSLYYLNYAKITNVSTSKGDCNLVESSIREKSLSVEKWGQIVDCCMAVKDWYCSFDDLGPFSSRLVQWSIIAI